MIVRLIIWLVVLAAPLSAVTYGIYRKRRNQRLLSAVRERGALNAALTCPDCFRAINPDGSDVIYEAGKLRHRQCFQKLLA